MPSLCDYFLVWLAAFFAYLLIIEPSEIYLRKKRNERKGVSH